MFSASPTLFDPVNAFLISRPHFVSAMPFNMAMRRCFLLLPFLVIVIFCFKAEPSSVDGLVSDLGSTGEPAQTIVFRSTSYECSVLSSPASYLGL